MFQLIAIRPLQGCYECIRKCLKEDVFYYFCDQYEISKDGIISRNRESKAIPDNFFSINGGHAHINLTAIVGKNGDGKSSIVELMIRLINNYTAQVRELTHNDVNPTVVIRGVSAELYYQKDSSIYRLYDDRGDGSVKLEKVATASQGGEVERLSFKDGVTESDEVAANFFYTMVTNFSHYAYNIYDFRREWVPVSAKTDSDDARCWLYYIFHKNDGYRSPLVLNPFRDGGNIDVNNEAYLNRQRLISLFLDADESIEDGPNFRRLEGKTARYITLKDPGESKLQQKTIVEHFMACRKDELLERAIVLARQMGNDDKVLNANKSDCLRQMRLIQTTWIHGNERLLEELRLWDKSITDRAKGVYEDAGFLSEKSDFATWQEELEKLHFGEDTDSEEKEKKQLIESFRPYRMFNLAQLQMIGLVRYVCDLMAGRDTSFDPGKDKFDLTPEQIVKPYKDLTRREKCEHYIIYKIIAIFETYIDEYKKPCRGFKSSMIGDTTVPKSLVSNAVNLLWTNIREAPSHSNLKLRQALNYLKQNLRDNGRDVYVDIDLEAGEDAVRIGDELDRNIPAVEMRERLVLPLEKLKSTITDIKNLELMPPPFYETEVVFVPDDNDEEVITTDTLSSGERQRLASLSSVIYHLRNLNSKKKDDVKYRDVNVVLEEIELYFHPECQRVFIKELIEMIERANLTEIDNINIILVTHSPFILSDIPKGNVLLLEKGRPAEDDTKRQLTTFGANIYDMLKTGFFLDGPVGAFAQKQVERVVKALRAKDEELLTREEVRERIELIDEPVMKRILIDEYSAKYDVELKRAYLQEELQKLENERV